MEALTVCMESEGSLDGGGLIGMFFGYTYHKFHSFGSKNHLIESKKRVLQSSAQVLPGLVFRLLPQLIPKVPFTELGTFQASVAIEDSEQPDVLVKIGCSYVCVLLYECVVILKYCCTTMS